MRKIYIIILCFVFLFLVNTVKIMAQTSCEEASGTLDAIIANAKDESLVIVIARLGNKEKNTNLNKRRLHNVKTYLAEYIKGSPISKHPENIILATGDKTDGLGIIEIYFKGILFSKFLLRHNADLFIGECVVDFEFVKSSCDLEAQKVFYPCLDKKRK